MQDFVGAPATGGILGPTSKLPFELPYLQTK